MIGPAIATGSLSLWFARGLVLAAWGTPAGTKLDLRPLRSTLLPEA